MTDPSALPAKIGFDVPFEPFGLIDNGKPAGMLIELVGALLQRAGVRHEFVSMTLAETEGALFGGKVDALAFKGVTPERLKTMAFSETLIVSGGAIFTRAGVAASANLRDYDGQTVATPRKGPLWAQIEKQYPQLKLIDGDSYQGSFDAVLAGRADIAALNLHAGIAIAKRLYPGKFGLPAEPYVPLPIAFATARGKHAELISALNDALAGARRDGTWQRIHDKWLGT